MNFIDFELGIWNAWILQVIFFIFSMMPSFLRKIYKGNKKEEVKKINQTPVKETRYAKSLYWILLIIFISSFIVTFFIPLQFESMFFYVGIILFLIGIILILFVIHSWIETDTNTIISTGIYQYSRHPMYISFMFSYIGICLATLSLLFIILTAFHIFFMVLNIKSEEHVCLMKFGNAYQEYMMKTPRWIGLRKEKEKM